MEVVLALFGKIAEYTVAPIGHQLGYLIQYSSNTESLRDQVESLKSVQHGNQGEVDAAERNGQVIREDVRTWLMRVEEITAESDVFFRDEVNPNVKCSSFSLCPNLVLRYKVSRKAKKKKLVVDEFLLKGNMFNNVSFPPQPPPILESMNLGDVEVFKSRDSIFKGIIEALKDDKTNIIGVYGMGGIGKTMLVKGVAKHTKEYKLFDDIVLTVVSQTPSITKIQDDIASILGLELHERESVLIRTGWLCERIKKSKRILVILDDLWTKLDLKEIGLPHVDVHKGCKILFTTRDYRVCVEMRSQIKFPIKVLSELETWDLFRKVAGDVIDSSDLKPIANEVAKECAGLPLSIVTVAGTLMEVKDLSVWRVALRRLQNPSTTNIPGMSAKVYSSLSLSYDFLDDKEAKDCFLLCCLAEEDSDIRINNLVGFGMGLGIFDYRYTLLDVKDTVRALVTKLKDKGLLLESKYVDCVRMHDVVRDFATSVLLEVQHRSWARIEWSQNILSAMNNDKFDCSTLKMLFLKSYDDSLVIPDNLFEQMKDLTALSMHIPKLPSSVLFSVKLRTLYLEGCSVEDISFIGNSKCLEILSFVRCHIQEFPREIEQLKSLRVLEFSKCVGLKVIPVGFLSSLSQLEGLYMYMSLVDWGKDSNASLVELNDLRGHLSTIDIHLPDVKFFPKDLHLETLSEFKISLGTEFSGVEWNDSFFPGFNAYDTFKCFNPRMLKIGNIDQSIASHCGVKKLVNKAESLIIEHFEVDLENILSELKREGFSRLKCLKVIGNQKIEYLVDKTKEDMLQKIFPDLEGLKLDNMRNLSELCRGRLPSGSFCELCELELINLPNLENLWVGNASLPNLRVVKIRDCGRMKNLFSQNVLSGFWQLSSLQVKNCQNIEEILAYDGAEAIEDDEIEFSNFKILRLSHLPNLTTFCSKRGNHILDERDNAAPPIQRAFFSEKIAFPNLEELKVSGKFEEIWPQKIPGNSFCKLRVLYIYGFHKIKTAIPSNLVQRLQNLEELRVTCCGGLRCLLSASQARDLNQLKRIKVYSCEMMKEIVATKELGEEETGDMKIVLPQLDEIELKDLQKLACFCNGNCTLELPLVTRLRIEKCPKLETLFISSGCEGKESQTASSSNSGANLTEGFNRAVQSLFNEKVLLPSLERLIFSDLEFLKEIWYNQRLLPADHSFSQLKELWIINCECLRNVLTPSTAKVLSSLTYMSIRSCSSLEAVIVAEEDQRQEICMREEEEEEEEKKIIITVFPQLRELWLQGLPQLKCFYNGRHCKLEFPSLVEVFIRDCPKIETLMGSTSGYECTELRIKELIDDGDDQEGSTNIIAKMEDDDDDIHTIMLFTEQVLLPSLESLDIWDLQFLKEIWYNQRLLPADHSFSQLKSLEISNCECLRNVLTPSIAKVLSSLRRIDINMCSSLEAVIVAEEDQRQEICMREEEGEEKKIIITVFPQLTELSLSDMPQLKCFYNGRHCKLEFPSLATLYIEGCPKIETLMLFSEQVLLPNLAELTIIGCDSLRNLLTPSVLKALSCLKELRIARCSVLEQVVVEEEQRIQVSGQDKVIVLPQLHKIELKNLSKLRSFYPGNLILEFPSLETLQVEECPHMQTFSPGHVVIPENTSVTTYYSRAGERVTQYLFKTEGEKDQCQSKEEEEIASSSNLGEMSAKDEKLRFSSKHFLEVLLPNLAKLTIEGCHSFRNLLSPSILRALSRLKKIRIKECSFLEQVVGEEEQRIQVSDYDKVIVFPQLFKIELKNLPKLRSFYPGNLTLEFPSLKKLSVKECPNMQTFSPGHVDIPENTAVTAYYSREGGRITQYLFKTEEEKDERKAKDKEEIASSNNLGEMSAKDEKLQFSSKRYPEGEKEKGAKKDEEETAGSSSLSKMSEKDEQRE